MIWLAGVAAYLGVGAIVTIHLQLQSFKQMQQVPNGKYGCDLIDIVAEILFWPIVIFLAWR